tara:strand:+ start:985 stop:1371 length:387 start_codon:yes stop_codon:yes gene_type:complete
MSTLELNKQLSNETEQDEMADANVLPTLNPHTQLDEIADAIDRGVPPDLIVHEAELEESRKRRQFVARFTLSLTQIGIFIMIITILFFFQITDAFRDLLNILIGGFLATFTKISDYWFKADSDEGKSK